MKTNAILSALRLPIILGLWCGFGAASYANALPISLGAAGPGNWAVLETGHHAAGANVSIANASGAGISAGNVGLNSTGSISDSGTPITGNVYVSTGGHLNSNVAANVSGSIVQNAASQTLLNQASADAAAAAVAAAALAGTHIADITTNDTLSTGGVYFLNSINLSNETLTLDGSASSYYIFNIASGISLSHGSILLSGGLTPDNVLFNILRVGGTGLGMSGGLATESILYGTVLAENSQVQETPGLVVGEIISGDNISIASGAQVRGFSLVRVPDATGTWLLMLIAGGALACFAGLAARRRSPATCTATDR